MATDKKDNTGRRRGTRKGIGTAQSDLCQVFRRQQPPQQYFIFSSFLKVHYSFLPILPFSMSPPVVLLRVRRRSHTQAHFYKRKAGEGASGRLGLARWEMRRKPRLGGLHFTELNVLGDLFCRIKPFLVTGFTLSIRHVTSRRWGLTWSVEGYMSINPHNKDIPYKSTHDRISAAVSQIFSSKQSSDS